ncbi:hypothetical protein J4E91_004764 [Alternaria rosae]|nr:hypothetical protein J4E91_004764 [Alternaria rosae]
MSGPQHSSVQAAIPATIEIPNLQILRTQVFESKKKIDSVEAQGSAATAAAHSEVEAARKVVAQGKERLERARERLQLELGRSVYVMSEGSKKYEGLRALLKTVEGVVREDGWTDLGT